MSYAVTVKGQVTLPKRVRDHLGVKPGEEVAFRVNDQGEVVVEKAARSKRRNPVAAWRGFFGPGPGTDEVLALTRGKTR